MASQTMKAAPSMNLVLDSDGIAQFNKLVQSFGIVYEKKKTDYIDVLRSLCDNAVVDGELHNKLKLFLEDIKQCKDEVGQVCDEIIKKNTNFKDDVDRKDMDFYKDGDIY